MALFAKHRDSGTGCHDNHLFSLIFNEGQKVLHEKTSIAPSNLPRVCKFTVGPRFPFEIDFGGQWEEKYDFHRQGFSVSSCLLEDACSALYVARGGFYALSDTHEHALTDPCFGSPSYSTAKMHTELSFKPIPYDGRVVNDRLQIRGGNLQNGTQAEQTYFSYQIVSKVPVEGKKPAEAAPDDKRAPVASDSKPASPDNKPCNSLWNDSTGKPICTRAVDDSGTVR